MLVENPVQDMGSVQLSVSDAREFLAPASLLFQVVLVPTLALAMGFWSQLVPVLPCSGSPDCGLLPKLLHERQHLQELFLLLVSPIMELVLPFS